MRKDSAGQESGSTRPRWEGLEADRASNRPVGLESIVGGEISAYVVALNEARAEAYGKMIKEAEKLGADAVINIRFVTSEVMPQAAEMLAYGTAVKLSSGEA